MINVLRILIKINGLVFYCDRIYCFWKFILVFFFKLRNLVRVLRGNEINLGNRKIVYRIIIMYVYNICMYVYLVCSCN